MTALGQFRSGSVWSLWDMLEKHAYIFAVPVANLVNTVRRLDDGSAPANAAKHVGDALGDLRRALILSDMDDPLPSLDRLAALVTDEIREPFVADAQSFIRRIFDDLKNQFYFHVDQRDVQYYGQKDVFGLSATAKFDEVLGEAESAGNCLALQQPTACVFHLMRVLERAIKVLARALKAQIDPKDTWFDIVKAADGAVAKLPSKTKAQISRKEELAVVCAHLQTVRLAWRNPVMHPKQTYTRDEALEVFTATKTLMSHLSALV